MSQSELFDSLGVSDLVSAENLSAWAEVAAITLLVCFLAGVGLGAIRALILGSAGVEVAARVTVALIGLGCAVSGALAGSRGAFELAELLATSTLATLALQVVGAIFGSEVAYRVFRTWLARPLCAWLRGEGAEQLGG